MKASELYIPETEKVMTIIPPRSIASLGVAFLIPQYGQPLERSNIILIDAGFKCAWNFCFSVKIERDMKNDDSWLYGV